MSKIETGSVPTVPERRSIGRRIGKIAFGIVAGLIVIALIGVGFVAYTVQRSFPQESGEIALEGLDAEVTVQRDALGIPVITADSSHDLFYAQGYVHAQDRFWEMDFRRHVTSGRVAELFGESQVATDKFLRTLGWREVAEQEVEALDESVRGYYDAYADGVNAYLADHQGSAASLEYAVLGLQNPDYEIEPWTPADSVAWLKAMAWDLRGNIETETERALMAPDFTSEQIAELYPAYPFDRNPVIVPTITPIEGAVQPVGWAGESGGVPTPVTASVEWNEVGSVVEAVSAMVGDVGEGIGSNSWVISGELTESGMPLLANDPHLGADMPSVWHQIGLRCAPVSDTCPFDVSGFGFSGVPGVVIGHNNQIAWGFTNLTTDVTDLYLEKVEGDEYWRDDVLTPLDERTETIEVAGGDPVELTIRSTVHGPIISGLTPDFTAIAEDPYTGTEGIVVEPADPPAGEYAVSLQWTALQPGTTASGLFAMNAAQDFTAFRAAAALFDVPAQNLVYADLAGNIGYQTPGRLPIRGAGDGSMPQPGWDSAYDWTGYIPFEELPVSFNPDEGYIVTANNAIVSPGYPYFLTNDWDYGWRGARIAELIERKAANGKLTADDMRDIQADDQFWMGLRLAAAYNGRETGDAEVDAALELLRHVGRAEHGRFRRRRVRQRAVGRARPEPLRARTRDRGAAVGPGQALPRRRPPARGPLVIVVGQPRPRCLGSGRDAPAHRRRRLQAAREAAGRPARSLELGPAARAHPHQWHVRIVGDRPDRVALQPRPLPGRRRQLDRERDRMDPGGGLRDRHRALDAHDRRPGGLRRLGLESPHRCQRPRIPRELRGSDLDLAAHRDDALGLHARDGRCGHDRHADARSGILIRGRVASTGGGQPPAAGGRLARFGELVDVQRMPVDRAVAVGLSPHHVRRQRRRGELDEHDRHEECHDRPRPERHRDREADEDEAEHLGLGRGMQARRHVAEPRQPDRGAQAQQRSDRDEHECDDVENGGHGLSPSLRATQRAIDTEPNTPSAAMTSITGSVRVWWLMAISAPSAHITSVSRTSAATARSEDRGPHDDPP